MRKDEVIAMELINRYKADVKDSGPVFVEADSMYGYAFLKRLVNHSKRYQTKRFHLQDMEPCSGTKMAPMIFGLCAPKKYSRDKSLNYNDSTGMWKLKFNDGSIIYRACIMTGAGSNKRLETFIATEKEVFWKWLKYVNRQTNRYQKPKPGFFVGQMTPNGLQYVEQKKPVQTPVIHEAIDTMKVDMEYFFNNNHIFTRYNMPGTRKIMLVGPPGTGKTSMCIKFAREYKDDKSIVIASDLGALVSHLRRCAQHKVSTIVIVEDAEAILNDTGMGTSSQLLNLLDGINQPTNKAGAYIIMTTNHPNRIEDRILKRPGRIDKIISVGPLKDQQAVECAKLYFPDEFKDWTNLENVVNNMTGAQIKELAQSTMCYAAQNSLKFDLKTVKLVKSKLTDDLSDAYKYAEDNTIAQKGNKVSFGFNS